MSGPWHPTGRAKVSSTRPRALAVCDRCGFTYNHQDLQWQYQWAGFRTQNIQRLVCRPCLDDLQQNGLRTVILPPDPLPVLNARPEDYNTEVPSYMSTEDTGLNLQTESGLNLTMMIRSTPSPNTDEPYIYVPED